MVPILVHFNKYLPSIHTIDNYYSIITSNNYSKNAVSLKNNQESSKPDKKIIKPFLKPLETTKDSFYI
ncbi:MAG: hypothetical protein ACTSWX_12010 [Promethearchaeota archaeon]